MKEIEEYLNNQLNPKFKELFSLNELKEMIKDASICGTEGMIIYNQYYYFELSSNLDKTIRIDCENLENSNYKRLNKKEFWQLYKSSSNTKISCIEVDI